MAWTLDRAYARVHPINPDLTYARWGATHTLSVVMEAHSGNSTLVSSVPLPVRVGGPIPLPKDPMGLREVVYGWNGSVDTPTITPDVDDGGRGAACFSLQEGVLTPLPNNREALLSGAIRLVDAPTSTG